MECKVGQTLPAGKLQFCILGYEERTYGVMPAVFFKKKSGEVEEIWRDRVRGFNPWKIEIAELDGDPEPEIALGVYKKTRRDPKKAKRLFIFDWTGYCLTAKWLGSSLSLPMEDFKFSKSEGDKLHHLFAIEEIENFKIIRKYRWNGFGFTGVEVVLHADAGDNLKWFYDYFEKIL